NIPTRLPGVTGRLAAQARRTSELPTAHCARPAFAKFRVFNGVFHFFERVSKHFYVLSRSFQNETSAVESQGNEKAGIFLCSFVPMFQLLVRACWCPVHRERSQRS